MTAPNKFEFEHGGKKYQIPAFKSLKAGVLRKARKGNDQVDTAFMILEMTLGEDSKELDAIDDMSVDELNEFMTGWTGGASVGESSGS
jgi:hypothetical protein